MPLYEYACDACGKRFEVIQKFSDPPPDACRKCGSGPVHRQHSSPAIQFKGSGWYVTDYAQKSGSDSGKSEGSASSSPADTKSADSAAKADSSPKADAPAAPTTPSAAPSSTTKE